MDNENRTTMDGEGLKALWANMYARKAAEIERFQVPCKVPNPLLTDVWLPKTPRRDPLDIFRWSDRDKAVRQYSWAVPSHEALTAISDASVPCEGRVLELGSGTGYWAKLLEGYGMRVVAVDDASDLKPGYNGGGDWMEKLLLADVKDNADPGEFAPHFPQTLRMDAKKYLQENDGAPDHVLFLCWPRNASEWISEYRGDTVVWVGEAEGGCTWAMNSLKGWTEVASVPIPQWEGIHDELVIYKRVPAIVQ